MAKQPEKAVDPTDTERAAGSETQPEGAGQPAEASGPSSSGTPSEEGPAPGETAPESAAGTGSAGLSAEELIPGLGDAVAAEEVARLREQVASLEAERDDLRDRLMRALAETENVRRRAERDRKDAETYGGTKLARDLLTVHDNLERAMAAADDRLKTEHASFFEGVELTARELLNAFAKHRIEPVRPEKGERFDPNRHQAMFEAPVPGAEPKTIIEVMQPGFVIADRLLRPALVGVAKAAPPAAPEPGPAPEPESAPESGGETAPGSGEDSPAGGPSS